MSEEARLQSRFFKAWRNNRSHGSTIERDLMRKCKVSPNSKRGKQLITAHGDIWQLVPMGDGKSMARPLQCFDNNLGFTIKSLDGYHSRNVRMIDDNNLTVY